MQEERLPNLRLLFGGLQKKLLESLNMDRSLSHSVAKGDASEADWHGLLEQQLPSRYQVDRGFVVDADGKVSDFIDLIIFDRQYCPLLFKHRGQTYVPAESVYAVFEVKQSLSRNTVRYAGDKAASVRRLRRTSAVISHAGGTYKPRKPFRIPAGLVVLESSWSPPMGKTLLQALSALDADQRLDLGCCLKHGAFVVTYKRDKLKTDISHAETALVSFFLSLLTRLQRLGTVPAMDLSAWGKGL